MAVSPKLLCFFFLQDIDGEILLTYVNPEEIKKELGIESAGHCRRLIISIDKLRGGEGQVATPYFHPSLLGSPAAASKSHVQDKFLTEVRVWLFFPSDLVASPEHSCVCFLPCL